MKLVVRRFSSKEVTLAANISSWSNKEVAEFLNKVINPKDADTKIFRLKPEQQKEIKEKLGSEAKMPASFKQIYQQFKDVKIQESKQSSNLKLSADDFSCIEYQYPNGMHYWVARLLITDGSLSKYNFDKPEGATIKSDKFDDKSILSKIIKAADTIIGNSGDYEISVEHSVKGDYNNLTASLYYTPENASSKYDYTAYKWDGKSFKKLM